MVRESGLGEEAYRALASLLKRGLILPVEGPKELCAKLVDLLKSRLGPRAEPLSHGFKGAKPGKAWRKRP